MDVTLSADVEQLARLPDARERRDGGRRRRDDGHVRGGVDARTRWRVLLAEGGASPEQSSMARQGHSIDAIEHAIVARTPRDAIASPFAFRHLALDDDGALCSHTTSNAIER